MTLDNLLRIGELKAHYPTPAGNQCLQTTNQQIFQSMAKRQPPGRKTNPYMLDTHQIRRENCP